MKGRARTVLLVGIGAAIVIIGAAIVLRDASRDSGPLTLRQTLGAVAIFSGGCGNCVQDTIREDTFYALANKSAREPLLAALNDPEAEFLHPDAVRALGAVAGAAELDRIELAVRGKMSAHAAQRAELLIAYLDCLAFMARRGVDAARTRIESMWLPAYWRALPFPTPQGTGEAGKPDWSQADQGAALALRRYCLRGNPYPAEAVASLLESVEDAETRERLRNSVPMASLRPAPTVGQPEEPPGYSAKERKRMVRAYGIHANLFE